MTAEILLKQTEVFLELLLLHILVYQEGTPAFFCALDCLLRMQAVVQILAPLAGPRVAEALRKTVNEMFGVYTQALAAGFAKYTRPDGTLPPRLGGSLPPFRDLQYPATIACTCATSLLSACKPGVYCFLSA